VYNQGEKHASGEEINLFIWTDATRDNQYTPTVTSQHPEFGGL